MGVTTRVWQRVPSCLLLGLGMALLAIADIARWTGMPLIFLGALLTLAGAVRLHRELSRYHR